MKLFLILSFLTVCFSKNIKIFHIEKEVICSMSSNEEKFQEYCELWVNTMINKGHEYIKCETTGDYKKKLINCEPNSIYINHMSVYGGFSRKFVGNVYMDYKLNKNELEAQITFSKNTYDDYKSSNLWSFSNLIIVLIIFYSFFN